MNSIYDAISHLPGYQLVILLLMAPSIVLTIVLIWILIFSKNKDYARVTLSLLGLNINLSVGTLARMRTSDRDQGGSTPNKDYNHE